MNKLKFSLIIGCVFLIALTAAFLYKAQKTRDWTDASGRVVLKSGVLDVALSESESSPSSSSDWSGSFKAGTRKTLTINGVEFAFCYCPAGTFTMGSPSNEEGGYDWEVQHEVQLAEGFWMLETELTQEQWDALGVKKKEECYFKGKNLPIENVSWDECVAFIDKLNASGASPEGMKFSLPTEAQWEYACRAGTKTAYFWGDSLNGDKANCDGNHPCGTTIKGKYLEKTSPVKSYAPNPWGLYDMHGNVNEWCADWYDDYPGGSVVDPTGATNASYRMVRGGSWRFDAGCCRSACRVLNDPANRDFDIGFRFLLESSVLVDSSKFAFSCSVGRAGRGTRPNSRP